MSYTRINYLPQEVLSLPTVDSATAGAIATFNTDLNLSLFKCVCTITASGGNGTPSTPIPIVGHSELNLVRCGVNLWDEETEFGSITWSTGETYNDNTKLRFKNFVKVNANTEYYIVCPSAYDIHFYEKNGTHISATYKTGNSAITTPNNAGYIRIALQPAYGTTYNHDISINYPSTDTEYHAYNGQAFTVSFGQTVYGGTYTADGKLRITWGYKDLGTCSWYLRNETATRQAWNTQDFIGIIKSPASLSTPYNALCDSFIGVDYNGTWLPGIFANSSTSDDTIAFCSNPNEFANADEFKASVNGVIFAYELATPIEIDVSELSVDTIVGVNNVFCDTGNIEQLTYFESVGMKIQKDV